MALQPCPNLTNKHFKSLIICVECTTIILCMCVCIVGMDKKGEEFG